MDSLIITLKKIGHFAALPEHQNYSVFSPPSKVVLKVLDRLKPQAEGIIVEKSLGSDLNR